MLRDRWRYLDAIKVKAPKRGLQLSEFWHSTLREVDKLAGSPYGAFRASINDTY